MRAWCSTCVHLGPASPRQQHSRSLSVGLSSRGCERRARRAKQRSASCPRVGEGTTAGDSADTSRERSPSSAASRRRLRSRPARSAGALRLPASGPAPPRKLRRSTLEEQRSASLARSDGRALDDAPRLDLDVQKHAGHDGADSQRVRRPRDHVRLSCQHAAASDQPASHYICTPPWRPAGGR